MVKPIDTGDSKKETTSESKWRRRWGKFARWWVRHMNIAGIGRLIFGYIRDSSGKINNVLGMFYLALGIFAVLALGSVFWGKAVFYSIDITCPPPVQLSSKSKRGRRRVPRKRRIKDDVKKRVKAAKRVAKGTVAHTAVNNTNKVRKKKLHFLCGRTHITVNLSLHPPQQIPTAVWWVSFAVLVFLGMLYAGWRRPETRAWAVNLIRAWKGQEPNYVEPDSSKAIATPPDDSVYDKD